MQLFDKIIQKLIVLGHSFLLLKVENFYVAKKITLQSFEI